MEAAMNEQHVPEWYIDSCKKIKYMFPKAHAVAYVMMAFRIAWFKVHEPLAFYATFFSIRAKAFDAAECCKDADALRRRIREIENNKDATAVEQDLMTTLEVCYEFCLRGFHFEPIDIYRSDATKFVVTEKRPAAAVHVRPRTRRDRSARHRREAQGEGLYIGGGVFPLLQQAVADAYRPAARAGRVCGIA